jgi:hypothetical protein
MNYHIELVKQPMLDAKLEEQVDEYFIGVHSWLNEPTHAVLWDLGQGGCPNITLDLINS